MFDTARNFFWYTFAHPAQTQVQALQNKNESSITGQRNAYSVSAHLELQNQHLPPSIMQTIYLVLHPDHGASSIHPP